MSFLFSQQPTHDLTKTTWFTFGTSSHFSYSLSWGTLQRSLQLFGCQKNPVTEGNQHRLHPIRKSSNENWFEYITIFLQPHSFSLLFIVLTNIFNLLGVPKSFGHEFKLEKNQENLLGHPDIPYLNKKRCVKSNT